MQRYRVLILASSVSLLGAVFPVSTRAAANLSVAPVAVPADYPGTVSIGLSGLTPAQEIRIEKFVDVNRSGKVDAPDLLIQSFVLKDGSVAQIAGAPNRNVPSDQDQATNGQISAALSFPSQSEPNRIAAGFLYRATPLNGAFAPLTAPFEVTPLAFASTISGRVSAQGSAAPYAVVLAVDIAGSGEFKIGAIANAQGDYQITAPPGIYMAFAWKTGSIPDLQSSETIDLTANASATANLDLVPSSRTLSGKVIDSMSGSGVPGVLVSTDSGQGFVFGFTDAQGNFSIAVWPDYFEIEVSDADLRLLGRLTAEMDSMVDATSTSVSNLTLQTIAPTALISGVFRSSNGQPLAGITLEGWSENYQSSGFSDEQGRFSLAAVPGFWSITPDQDSLPGYLLNSINIEVVSNQVETVEVIATPASAFLRGRLSDDLGQPISQTWVGAWKTDDQLNSGVETAEDGSFSLPLVGGVWELNVYNHGAGLNLRKSFTVVDGVNQENVQLVLPRTALTISGQLVAAGAPIPGISIYAFLEKNGTNYNATAVTGPDGRFQLNVFSGRWELSPDRWLLEAQGYVPPSSQQVDAGASVTFVAQSPSVKVNGLVVDSTGNPVVGAELVAYGVSGFANAASDWEGRFVFRFEPGVWRIHLLNSYAISNLLIYPNLELTFSGPEDRSLIYVIQRPSAQISGALRTAANQPIEGVDLFAHAIIAGTNYTAHAVTGANGEFSLPAINGEWIVSANCYLLEQRGYTCPQTAAANVQGNSVNLSLTVQTLNSDLLITSWNRGASGFLLNVQSSGGNLYQVQGSVDLKNWTTLYSTNLPAASASWSYHHPIQASADRYFFKVIRPWLPF